MWPTVINTSVHIGLRLRAPVVTCGADDNHVLGKLPALNDDLYRLNARLLGGIRRCAWYRTIQSIDLADQKKRRPQHVMSPS